MQIHEVELNLTQAFQLEILMQPNPQPIEIHLNKTLIVLLAMLHILSILDRTYFNFIIMK
jgi:hypothetical protein